MNTERLREKYNWHGDVFFSLSLLKADMKPNESLTGDPEYDEECGVWVVEIPISQGKAASPARRANLDRVVMRLD